MALAAPLVVQGMVVMAIVPGLDAGTFQFTVASPQVPANPYLTMTINNVPQSVAIELVNAMITGLTFTVTLS